MKNNLLLKIQKKSTDPNNIALGNINFH